MSPPPVRDRPQDPIDDSRKEQVSGVGESLELASEHMAGRHVEPRDDCWRCGAERRSDDASDR